MADIHAKSKCFILTPDGYYEEISYTELRRRRSILHITAQRIAAVT